MVIGDTPHDIRCAQAIDAFAVGVATGSNTLEELAACGPDLLLKDLQETTHLLAEINTLASASGKTVA